MAKLLGKTHSKVVKTELIKLDAVQSTETSITQQNRPTKTIISPSSAVKIPTDQPQKSIQRLVNNEKVAVIGISGRFPGADSIEEFWQLLIEGESGITEVPPERWDVATHYDLDRQTPNKTYSKWGWIFKRYRQI